MKSAALRGVAGLAGLAVLLGVWNPSSDEGGLRAQFQSASAKYQVDPFWPKPLPQDWITGSVGGDCVDGSDHVFIVSRTADAANLTDAEKEVARPSPPVIEFDSEGRVVNSWGDPAVVPSGIHGCYFDHEGNFWVGGNTDAIVQKYSHDGKLLLQIGTKGKFDASDETLQGAALNASRTLLNKPSGIAVDPANDDVYISDGYGNRRIVVFDRRGNYLRQFGHQATKEETAQGAGGAFTGIVHCVVLANDGLVYVCDRDGKRVQVFDKTGNFKQNITIPRRRADLAGSGAPWWIVLSQDPAQKYMLISDGRDEMIWTVERGSGKVLSGFGQMGHMAGEFTYLHTMAVNSRGDLFTGETIGGRRVQKFNLLGGASGG